MLNETILLLFTIAVMSIILNIVLALEIRKRNSVIKNFLDTYFEDWE